MAMTFSFALVGAMIFCLTYVPVISSIFSLIITSLSSMDIGSVGTSAAPILLTT